MFPFDAAFVMTLLALAMRRVRRQEWFSSAIAVFTLGLAAMAVQPDCEAVLRGTGDSGAGQAGFAALGLLSVWCFLQWLEDRKNPPDRPSRRTGR